MAKAYYPKDGSFVAWTPDMVSALGDVYKNGYHGMATMELDDSGWIRTTQSGLIPYNSGGASALGTSSWPFNTAYITTMHGTADKATSATSATTATKLSSARTIALGGYGSGSATFDGSANITITDTQYGFAKAITGNNTDTPYCRICYTSPIGDWNDKSIICSIDAGYKGGGFGIFQIVLRSDQISTATVTGRTHGSINWLVRSGFSADQLIMKVYSPASTTASAHYADVYFKASGTYNAANIRVLNGGGRGSNDPRCWTFTTSSEASRAAMDVRTYNAEYVGVDAGITNKSNYVNDVTAQYSGSISTTSWLAAFEGSQAKIRAISPANVRTVLNISNVENKSSATIRGELTKANVTTALGYTPPTTNTTYSAATQSAAGLMSATDKAKLDGIASGANKYTYTLPTATSSTLGGVKVGSNITLSSGTISLTKANVTSALGYTPPTSDTNTDTKVTQTVTTANAAYPLLLAPSGQAATATTTSYFDSGVTLNPSTNTIAANVSGSSASCTGNAATATRATKLSAAAKGSATQPVYVTSDGVPTACTYTLGKSVPSNAVFTDTKTVVAQKTQPTDSNVMIWIKTG